VKHLRAVTHLGKALADPPQYDPSWLASIGSVSARTLDAYAAAAEEVA
jgi:hypothetical protein